jgi:hypothetical protein
MQAQGIADGTRKSLSGFRGALAANIAKFPGPKRLVPPPVVTFFVTSMPLGAVSRTL